ncbi:MAG: serine protease, partial [Pseudarthrobacter sp.]|nr:serine protease [Pseudarthrobacter sp.]
MPQRPAKTPFARRARSARNLVGGVSAAVVAFSGLAAMPAAAAAPEEEHAYIVVLKDSVQDVGATAAGQWQKYSVDSSHTYRYAFKGYSGTMTPSEAANLRTDAAVEFVAAARTFELPPTPVAVEPQAVPAWWQRVGGTTDDGGANLPGEDEPLVGVNTAVIDSGIDSTHPDL